MNSQIEICMVGFFDGACEPKNPGGSIGIGAVLYLAPENPLEANKPVVPDEMWIEVYKFAACYHRGERSFTETSNNVAEYCACLALATYIEKESLSHNPILLCGDSKLVVNQMNGEWEMNAGAYIPYAQKLKALLASFAKVRFHWIPREQNSPADDLSKKEMINRGVEFRIQKLNKNG